MKYIFVALLLFTTADTFAQHSAYTDSITSFRTRYINTHGALNAEERTKLRFYPVDSSYAIQSEVERIYDAPWFAMETSGAVKKTFRAWALLYFTINNTQLTLTVYQSQQLMQSESYANYLFIPFTDLTNGEQTYENGRYIDCTTEELDTDNFLLDFNKAYNPYCAYIKNKYNCPVPPSANQLLVYVKAGEKKWAATEK